MSSNKDELKLRKLFEALFDAEELKLLDTIKKNEGGKK